MPFVAVALSCMLAAQDPSAAPAPTAEQCTAAIEAATAGLTRLAPRRSQLDPEEWRAAEVKLGEAMTAFLAKPEIYEWEHVARAIQTTWRAQCPGACASLCELALARFEPTAELHSQLGMSRWAMAEHDELPFAMRDNAARAAAAFLASRKLGEREPAFVFAAPALMAAGDFDAALADLDVVLAHPKFAAVVRPAAPGIRALALLALGRGAAAVAALEAEAAADADRDAHRAVTMARALALAGRSDEAIAAAKAECGDRPRAKGVALLADVLAFAGRHDEALAWLRAHPPERGKLSVEAFAEIERSRAAHEFLIGLRGKRPADLRVQLVKVLGAVVKVGAFDGFTVQQDSGQREKQTDMNASPQAVGSWVCSQPSSAYSWALDALFVVCVDEAPKWEGGGLERALLEGMLPKEHWQAITGAGAPAKARAVFAGQRLMPYAEGVLTAGQLLGVH